MKPFCIPGLPVKYADVCVDPEQRPLSHIIRVAKISTVDGGPQMVGEPWLEPNTDDYPEYEYVIQQFIDNMEGSD